MNVPAKTRERHRIANRFALPDRNANIPPREGDAWKVGFRDGYVCAVATILRAHGEDTIARDVLRCIGKITQHGTNPEDWEVLLNHGLV